jgi:uncharacterized protein (DUF305 family)
MIMKLLLPLTVLLALSFPAAAQDHAGHGAAPAAGPATAAYEAANAKMHQEMMIEYSGDADVDFLRNMIPHHQSAVEMARIVLLYGKDPEVKALAEEVIKAQEAEIALMEQMLTKLGQ